MATRMNPTDNSLWQKIKNAVGHSAELAISLALISVCIVVAVVSLLINYSGDEDVAAEAPAQSRPAVSSRVATSIDEESEAVEKMRSQLASTLREAAEDSDREEEILKRQAELEERLRAEKRTRQLREEERRRVAAQSVRQPRTVATSQLASRPVTKPAEGDLSEILALVEDTGPAMRPSAPAPRPAAAPRQLTKASIDWDSCDRPSYPRASKRAGDEGVVDMLFSLDEWGNIRQSAIKSSSGHERLDEAALTAISKCRFSPAKENGTPVAASLEVRFTWRLD